MKVVRVEAPGRVNLIGDHTDYTGGLVLPMVLERRTAIEGSMSSNGIVRVSSDDEPGIASFPVDVEDMHTVEHHWARYVAAMVRELRLAGVVVPGFEAHITSDLPIGAGLSSSAALEIAVGRFVRELLSTETNDSFDIDDVSMARLAQRAEHVASGVPCGIMDQLCIAVGRANDATLIDCHDLSIRHVVLPESIEVVVRFVAHRTLAGSEYADRVADCRAIEERIGPLRSASEADLHRLTDERLIRRATHVITENRRVRDAVKAIETDDIVELGRLMTESHRSLATNYETSNATMDRAVADLLADPAIMGARMTGGGFGGCVVAIRRR